MVFESSSKQPVVYCGCAIDAVPVAWYIDSANFCSKDRAISPFSLLIKRLRAVFRFLLVIASFTRCSLTASITKCYRNIFSCSSQLFVACRASWLSIQSAAGSQLLATLHEQDFASTAMLSKQSIISTGAVPSLRQVVPKSLITASGVQKLLSFVSVIDRENRRFRSIG